MDNQEYVKSIKLRFLDLILGDFSLAELLPVHIPKDGKNLILPKQFVIFKPLSYCFKETKGFDVKASFASCP